jgi:hypothetical protein
MQSTVDQAAATSLPIPTVTFNEDENVDLLMGTFAVRRKTAKRSESWYQTTSAPLTVRARNKPRRGEPLRTNTATIDRATHPPTDAATDHTDAASDHADSDSPVWNMLPMVRPSGTSYRWIPEEDVKLISAITNTRKKKWGKEYRTDWGAIAALVPGRTKMQCHKRWCYALDPNIDQTNGRKGRWIEVEDIKLKEAVQKHGCKN